VQTETITSSTLRERGVTFNYNGPVLLFGWDDIDGASGTLAANARADIVSGSIRTVRAKAASSPAFRNYAVA